MSLLILVEAEMSERVRLAVAGSMAAEDEASVLCPLGFMKSKPAYLQRSGWANSPFEEAARKLRLALEDEPRRAVRLNEIDAMDRELKA